MGIRSRLVGVGVALVLSAVAVGVAAQAPGDAIHRWAVAATASTNYGSSGQWSAESATGEPDVTEYSDNQFAWTPKLKDGTTDWLDLRFDQSVIPTAVSIHESFSPGFVTKVEAYHTADAAWVTLWEGTDPTPLGAIGIFSPQLTPTGIAVDRIRVTIDTNIPDYNEIDAVELVGMPPGDQVTAGAGAPTPPGPEITLLPAATASAAPVEPSLAPPADLQAQLSPEELQAIGQSILEAQWERFGLAEFDPELPAILTELQQRGAADLTDYLAQQPPLEIPGASSGRTGLVASISGVPPRSDPRQADQGGIFLDVMGEMFYVASKTVAAMPVGPAAARLDPEPYVKNGTETVGGREVPVGSRTRVSQGTDHGRISQTIEKGETYNIPDKVTGALKAHVFDGATVSYDIGVCPDQSGQVTGRVEVSAENTFTAAAGPGYHSTFQGSDDFVVQVTDQATVAGTQHAEESHRTNSGLRPAFGANPAALIDSNFEAIRSSEAGPTGAIVGTPLGTVIENEGTDAADMKVWQLATSYVRDLADELVRAASDRWRSGDCVAVTVPQGNGGEVEAGSETQVVAQPRHKIDQVDLAKPVVATFSGTAGAQPMGVAVQAPAQFTYTAGDNEDDTGTLTLTSTSNRGIGSTSVLFRVPKKQTPTPPPETPTPRPPPTPEPTPEPLTGLRGTIHYRYEMESVSSPGHTQVLDMDMDLVLRAFNGRDPSPIDEDGQIEISGPSTFHARYHEEVPCGDGDTQVLEGEGGGSITSVGVAYVNSDFADEGMITLPSFETDDFHIVDHPCPGGQVFDQDGSLGPRITQCDPDGDFLTGITRGIRGHAEERDGAYGFAFDCTDTGGDDSVKLTVTMSGFLAGTNDVPGQ